VTDRPFKAGDLVGPIDGGVARQWEVLHVDGDWLLCAVYPFHAGGATRAVEAKDVKLSLVQKSDIRMAEDPRPLIYRTPPTQG
jgi:hypothetical protein